MKPREILRKGLFNTMNVEQLADDSQIVTLTKDGESKAHKFRVINLNQKGERELPLNES